MVATASSFETVANRNAGNIRKALKGTVLLGKFTGTTPAPLVTTLVAPNGQILLPDSYESAGWLSEDGLTFSRDRDVSEVRGWGSGTVLRRDIKSDDRTIQFAMLETKRLSFELKNNMDLSATQMSAGGEFKVPMVGQPDTLYWRLIAIGVDGVGTGRYYTAKTFNRATVSDMDDETWTDGDDALMTNVTMTALPDTSDGTLGTEFIFGPGALAAAAAMGITVATS